MDRGVGVVRFPSPLTAGALGVASVAVAYKLAGERLGGFRSWLQICERTIGLKPPRVQARMVGKSAKKRNINALVPNVVGMSRMPDFQIHC